MLISCVCASFVSVCNVDDKTNNNNNNKGRILDYNNYADAHRLRMKAKAKEMFYFGYDNYMKYAYPQDELNPIHCKVRKLSLLAVK